MPVRVVTGSPMRSASTAVSPDGVAIRVPAQKQATTSVPPSPSECTMKSLVANTEPEKCSVSCALLALVSVRAEAA